METCLSGQQETAHMCSPTRPPKRVSRAIFIFLLRRGCFCPRRLPFFSIIIYLNNYCIKGFRFRSSALRVLLKLLSPPEFIQRTNYRSLFFLSTAAQVSPVYLCKIINKPCHCGINIAIRAQNWHQWHNWTSHQYVLTEVIFR